MSRKLSRRQFVPPDVPAWDDASNNKWLIAGRGALIMNPPSAWAVAKRDAPQVAEQCWTHGFWDKDIEQQTQLRFWVKNRRDVLGIGCLYHPRMQT
jgi:hypothetical protein